MIEELGISLFTYSMLSVLGYGTLLVGAQVYERYFKEFEYRTMMKIDIVIIILLRPLEYLLVSRLNL